MKKFLMILTGVLVLGLGGYQIADHFIMGGEPYYVQITTTGKKISKYDQAGNAHTDFSYDLPAYNEAGAKKDVQFNGNKSRPLRENAYLKLTVNADKGVTSFEEVTKSAVPQKALTKLAEN